MGLALSHTRTMKEGQWLNYRGSKTAILYGKRRCPLTNLPVLLHVYARMPVTFSEKPFLASGLEAAWCISVMISGVRAEALFPPNLHLTSIPCERTSPPATEPPHPATEPPPLRANLSLHERTYKILVTSVYTLQISTCFYSVCRGQKR
jgi:hypothetical protein